MELDVLICTHGARAWVERCVGSLLAGEGRERFRILIHDNAASERDGTREYLHAIADCEWRIADLGRKDGSVVNPQPAVQNSQSRIMVFYDDKDLTHGQALDFLAARATAPWFLAMDSDVEVVRKDWLEVAERVVAQNPHMVVCAAAQALWVTSEARYSMPRADPSFALVSTKFFRRERLSFTVIVMRATVLNPDRLPGALKGKRSLTLAGDTGWQLLHAAMRTVGDRGQGSGDRNGAAAPRSPAPGTRYLFVTMPEDLRSCYVHHGSRSIQFHEMGGGAMKAGDLVEVVYTTGPGSVGTVRGKLAVRANPDIVLTETTETAAGQEVRSEVVVIPRRREVLTRLVKRQ